MVSHQDNIRIIPRVDVKVDNVVKGVHLEGLRVLGSPHIFSHLYFQELADEIIFMDSVASLYGRNNLKAIVASAAKEIFIPMTVGGGIKSIEDAKELLESGADKVAINSALFDNPFLISDIANHNGSQCVVVSVDVIKEESGKYICLSENGREYTGQELFEWLDRVVDLGAGEILLTSVDREGTGLGYDINLVREVVDKCPIPVVACGGSGSSSHVKELIDGSGVEAISASSIFHYELATRGLDIGSLGGNKDFINKIQNIDASEIRKSIEPTSVLALKEYLNKQGIAVRTK